MPARRLARSLLATWFVDEGWQVLRRPEPHVAEVRATWADLGRRVDLPPLPDDAVLRQAVRAHGAAVAVAGGALGLGILPRVAGVALAGLTAPLLLSALPTSGRELRHLSVERRARLARSAGLVGAALLAALDRGGKPSLVWRFEHARAVRAREQAALAED